MKSILVFISVYLFFIVATKIMAIAQRIPQNFAVPESPAFLILGTAPSDILRPSTVRELAAIASDFTGEGLGFILPKSFAAEFSPGMLLSPNKNSSNNWEKFRISIGTQRPDSNLPSTQLAIGLRYSIIDEADIRQDPSVKSALTKVLLDYLMGLPLAPPPPVGGASSIVIPPEIMAQYNRILQDAENATWSKDEFDVALAFRFSSTDSLAKSLRFDKASLWSTYALRCGVSAQNVAGFNAALENNLVTDSLNFFLNIYDRFYIGSNYYKGFAEVQYSSRDKNLVKDSLGKLSLSLGGELKIFDGIWAEFSAGVSSNFEDRAAIISNFRLKYGI